MFPSKWVLNRYPSRTWTICRIFISIHSSLDAFILYTTKTNCYSCKSITDLRIVVLLSAMFLNWLNASNPSLLFGCLHSLCTKSDSPIFLQLLRYNLYYYALSNVSTFCILDLHLLFPHLTHIFFYFMHITITCALLFICISP